MIVNVMERAHKMIVLSLERSHEREVTLLRQKMNEQVNQLLIIKNARHSRKKKKQFSVHV